MMRFLNVQTMIGVFGFNNLKAIKNPPCFRKTDFYLKV